MSKTYNEALDNCDKKNLLPIIFGCSGLWANAMYLSGEKTCSSKNLPPTSLKMDSRMRKNLKNHTYIHVQI